MEHEECSEEECNGILTESTILISFAGQVRKVCLCSKCGRIYYGTGLELILKGNKKAFHRGGKIIVK